MEGEATSSLTATSYFSVYFRGAQIQLPYLSFLLSSGAIFYAVLFSGHQRSPIASFGQIGNSLRLGVP